MTEAQISSLVSAWQRNFNGVLLPPSDDEFAVARRVWNGMIDRQPALIARCTSAQDVISAIKLARAEGLHLSVRGGGHSVAGSAVCQDGLMVDLSPMKNVSVDPARREAVAEPGVLWGITRRVLTDWLQRRASVSYGDRGLNAGRRTGYLMGKHGAVCDNLLSVDLVPPMVSSSPQARRSIRTCSGRYAVREEILASSLHSGTVFTHSQEFLAD